MAKITSIPEAERRRALEIATGTILPTYISPEQWIRHSRLRWAFLLLGAILIVILAISTIAILNPTRAVLTEVRSDLGRIVTKFNSVYVQAVYELPENEPSVKLLEEAVTEIVQAVQKDHKPFPQGMGLSYSYSANGDKSPEQPVISVELNNLLHEDFTKLSPKLVELVSLIMFLQHPKLQIGINRSIRSPTVLVNSFLNIGDPPDLYMFAHDWPVDSQKGHFGKVIVDSKRKKVLVAWNGFEYPPDRWVTSRKVVSIQDCDQSQFVVMLSNSGNVDPLLDNVASKFIPVWVNVRFDNNFVTFVDFEGVSPVQNWKVFSAKFPSAQDILDGKAAHSLDPSYSWGY